MAHFLLLFTTLILFPFSNSSQISGKITIGSSITATKNSKPWLSPSRDFAFGFQQLQNNSTYFVLAIWFAKIPDKTIAWFERTSYPVPRGSTLKLEATKGLVLYDRHVNPLYITDDLADEVAYAFMSNTGNLILSQTNSTSLWESFSNPSDTILPTQKIEINGSTLISKKTKNDFSYGRFYAGMNTDGNFVLHTKSLFTNTVFDDEYYNSDLNPGGALVVFDESTASISVVSTNNRQRGKTILISANLPRSEYYYRATLDFDGVLALYYYPKKFDNNSTWVYIGSLPDHNICLDIDGLMGSGACGYNSVCRVVNWRPVCYCPEGFSWVDPNNTYGDCKLNFPGNCIDQGGKDDLYEIKEYPDVDWPNNDYQLIRPSSVAECRDSCFYDYFCGAAIFRSGGCWKKRLPLSNGKFDTSLGVVSFLKVRRKR